MNSQFEWLHPEAFILILPLCVVWLGVALYARAKRRAAAGAFVSAAMQPRMIPKESASRFWTKTALVGAAFIFGLVALARPRFGVYYEDVKARGSDIYILIDVSRSMLATDVPPSRLERAKADVHGLLNHLHGERVGLIAFAGVAVVKCPLTTDYNFFRMTLDELNPNSVPKGGTAIGDAIRKALDVMPKLNEREQAMLLITDGGDQESYPLEAAAAAAERSVTIFTVGLGDNVQGARIPLESGSSGAPAPSSSFLTYKGEQVWSKMEEQLLTDIAHKTNGVYVPARTRAYDLGELYADHLAKMRGADGATQKRMRLSEQYQWFMALAILCLIVDLFVRLYKPQAVFPAVRVAPAKSRMAPPAPPVAGPKDALAPPMPTTLPPASPGPLQAEAPLPNAPATRTGAERLALLALTIALPLCASRANAGEERELVRQGLELYKKNDIDGAKDKFEKAIVAQPKERDAADAADAAVTAFDLACAYQRKGDTEHARDNYLKAAMSPDKTVSASARFNLGCLSADAARASAGEHPEEVGADKRKEILEKLKEAVGSYRMCLEIQPDRADARKNLETIRSWVKLYTDKWREMDKKKQREQANLIQYLESIAETQRVLRESVLQIKPDAMLDVFAVHKQAQRELLEEIEPLKQKIQTTLKRPPQPQGAPGNGAAPPALSAEEQKQLDEAVATLVKWADAAGMKMKSAADLVDGHKTEKAAADQKDAIAELERIWDVVVPFNALLAHDIAAETAIVNVLHPEGATDSPDKKLDWFDNLDSLKHLSDPNYAPPQPTPVPLAPPKPTIELTSKESETVAELQERTTHRTDLLKTKAEGELQQLEKQPATPPQPAQPDPKNPQPQAPDPEKIKEGLRKAVELAPKASEHETAAAKALRKDDGPAALPEAQEAKRILEEILKAQPKPPEQKDQDKKDQDKKDQQKKDQQKKDEQNKKDEQKKDQDKKDQDKKDQEKKDQQKKNDKDKQPKPDEKEPKEKEQMSREQAEAILRKVREREQQHRKDQEQQARLLGGPMQVDKDW